MAKVKPYITFDGNCEEAFNFYKSVFGGEFVFFGRFNEMPEDFGIGEDEKNKVMHVSLAIGDTILMGSDKGSNMGPPHNPGNNFSVSIDAESKEEADKLFADLSADGHITMPLMDTFWGSYFGTLIDKYGIQWMVSFGQ